MPPDLNQKNLITII